MHSLRFAIFAGLCHAAMARRCNSAGSGPNGTPATPAPMPNTGEHAVAPEPTVAPTRAEVEVELAKRQNGIADTCGFQFGNTASPFGCASNSRCITYGKISVIGCCPNSISVSNCIPDTACLDSTAYNTWTNPSLIPAETGWCTNADFPYCVQFIYNDSPVSGFTWLQCGTAYTREVVYHVATATPTTSSSSSSSSSSTSSSTSTAPVSDNGGSSAPVGAIVGGVVGGIAVIALLVLALFFILRKKRDPAAQTGPAAAAGGAVPPTGQVPPANPHHSMMSMPPPSDGAAGMGGGVPMAYAPAPAAYDPRGSMYKPPYDGASTVGSAPGSPLQHQAGYPAPYTHLGGGVPYQESISPQPTGYGQSISPQPTGFQQHHSMYGPPGQQHYPGANAAELPTERGDGQLQELHG